jgi:acetyl esterase/lipase
MYLLFFVKTWLILNPSFKKKNNRRLHKMKPIALIKKRIFILLLLTVNVITIQAQFCTADTRFTEVEYFNYAEIDSNMNLIYGIANDWQGQPTNLLMDVYYPATTFDTLQKRPFILLMHGGGFINGAKEQFSFECREFAKRGFVAATMNYRLGNDCLADTNAYSFAAYRAAQDAHALMRVMVENASSFKIDTAWMFAGGNSAGTFTALHLVYLTQAEWNMYTPLVAPLLGNLHQSGNNLTHTFNIQGIYNNWGGVAKMFIEPHEMVPMISFHGGADPTVPVDSALGSDCVSPPLLYGSRALHQSLVQHGTCSQLTVKPGAGHGIYNSTNTQKLFRVQQVSCFFKSLFCNTCSDFYTTDSIPAHCSGLNIGMEPGLFAKEVMLYPNPASTQIRIQGVKEPQGLIYTVYNTLGQLCYPPTQADFIHIENLDRGIYILQVEKNNQTRYFRFIKE